MGRGAARRDIGRRRGEGRVLDTRAQAHRDHVPTQMLAIANTGIAIGGREIDEPIIHHDLDADIGIST